MLIERDPHQIVEGVVISAFAIEAHHAFIYVRGEFALGIERLEQARRRRVRAGASSARTSSAPASTSRSSCTAARARTSPATRRVCSRASRASARCRASSRRSPRCRVCTRSRRSSTTSRPCRPSRTSSAWVARSTPSSASVAPRARASSRSRVTSSGPGNYEVELGITFRELIEDLAGGVRGGKQMKFFIPGGASAPWLMPEHLDAPLDMDYVGAELKTMLGSGAIMVFDEDVNPALVAWRLLEVLRARELRQVHAVSRGIDLARAGAVPDRRTVSGGPQDLDLHAVVRLDDRPRPQRAVRADHHLRDGTEHDVAGGQPRPLLPRGDRRTAAERRPEPASSEGD